MRLIIFLSLHAVTLLLQLIPSILFEDFEATAKTLALLLDEDSLFIVGFLVYSASGLCRWLFVFESITEDVWYSVPRQMQRT